MNTVKITEAELNRKIAEARGDIKCGELYVDGMIAERVEDGVVPDYTSNMNLAITLLDELPGANLCKDMFIPGRWECYYIVPTIDGATARRCMGHTSKAMAICLAWLRSRTGEVYEVIE